MRKVIAFRATKHQLEVLEMAEKIYQKPACKIICEMIETDLPDRLRLALKQGARPMPFTPPIQRQRRKNDAGNPC